MHYKCNCTQLLPYLQCSGQTETPEPKAGELTPTPETSQMLLERQSLLCADPSFSKRIAAFLITMKRCLSHGCSSSQRVEELCGRSHHFRKLQNGVAYVSCHLLGTLPCLTALVAVALSQGLTQQLSAVCKDRDGNGRALHAFSMPFFYLFFFLCS